MGSWYGAAALTSQNHVTKYFHKVKDHTKFNGSRIEATLSLVLWIT